MNFYFIHHKCLAKNYLNLKVGNQDSRVSAVTKLFIGWNLQGLIPRESRLFQKRPNQLWGQSGLRATLTSHLHLMLRLRMSEAVPVLPSGMAKKKGVGGMIKVGILFFRMAH